MSTTSAPVVLSHARGQAAHGRVTGHLPDLVPVLASIAVTTPQQEWLTRQGRANGAANQMLSNALVRPGADRRFGTHVVAQLVPVVSLGALADAVVHALSGLAAVEDRHVTEVEQDIARAAVLYVIGRAVLDPHVYRRAVAPLVQAGADVPYHDAEWPAGDQNTPEHARGCAYRAGYRAATYGEPHSDDQAARMYPGYADMYASGYLAARIDQEPV